jgi:predicted transcriptional regulator
MLALRLPPEIEERLDALAKRTGRSKSYYARQAILDEDLWSGGLSFRRWRKRISGNWTAWSRSEY